MSHNKNYEKAVAELNKLIQEIEKDKHIYNIWLVNLLQECNNNCNKDNPCPDCQESINKYPKLWDLQLSNYPSTPEEIGEYYAYR